MRFELNFTAWLLLAAGVAVATVALNAWLDPVPRQPGVIAIQGEMSTIAEGSMRNTNVIDVNRIPAWSLFGRQADSATADAAPPEPDVDDLPETQIPAVLAGVLFTNEASGAWAIIDADGSRQRNYTIGDSLPGGAVVTAIQNKVVVLERNGRREALRLREDRGGGESSAAALPQQVASPGIPTEAIRRTRPVADRVIPRRPRIPQKPDSD